MKKIIYLLVIGTLMLASCSVNDPISDTPHPEQGELTLTTNWDARTNGIAIPASYTVLIDGKTLTLSGTKNTLPLLAPDIYPCLVYNTADKVSVEGNIATVASSNGVIDLRPDWFFSSALQITATADKKDYYTAVMEQQIRLLTFEMTIKEGDPERIAAIRGELLGVASQLDMMTGKLSGEGTVLPIFTRTGDKISASVRLLGITGVSQKLVLTITFSDSTTQDIESDLTSKLSDFNTNKKDPLRLTTDINTPIEIDKIEATITDWIVGIDISGIAD